MFSTSCSPAQLNWAWDASSTFSLLYCLLFQCSQLMTGADIPNMILEFIKVILMVQDRLITIYERERFPGVLLFLASCVFSKSTARPMRVSVLHVFAHKVLDKLKFDGG